MNSVGAKFLFLFCSLLPVSGPINTTFPVAGCWQVAMPVYVMPSWFLIPNLSSLQTGFRIVFWVS